MGGGPLKKVSSNIHPPPLICFFWKALICFGLQMKNMAWFWQVNDRVGSSQDSTYICWCIILWTTEWFWFGPCGIILTSNIIFWPYKIPICLTTYRTVSIVVLQNIQYSLTVYSTFNRHYSNHFLQRSNEHETIAGNERGWFF